MDVQRVRHTERVQSAGERVDDLARRDLPVAVGLVHVQAALVELEGRDAARVDDLDAHRLGRVQGPADQVAELVRVGALGQHLQEQLVVAEHHVGAVVEDGGVAHLHVGVAGVGGDHRGLERRGVAHLHVAPAGVARAGRDVATRVIVAAAVVFGQQQPGQVHLAAADVGVQVDAAGHGDAAADVDGFVRRLAGRQPVDAPVAHDEIAHVTVDAVGRVVQAATVQPDRAHAAALPGARDCVNVSTTAATPGSPSCCRACSGISTAPSTRNRCPSA